MNFKPKYTLSVFILSLVGCAVDQEGNTNKFAETSTPNPTQTQLISDQKQAHVADKVLEQEASSDRLIANEQALASSINIERQAKVKRLAKGSYELASSRASMTYVDYLPHPHQSTHNEKYASLTQHAIKQVKSDPVSTFSIDVDTGSYTNIRRMLNQGVLPPTDAVRIEEMINYFDYAYPAPQVNDAPFSIQTELALSPWSQDHMLLRVGLKGYEPISEERPVSNLVFLLDVSGSMSSPNKLPLLKKSLLLLSKQLSSEDKVSIVVYAGASGVVLEPTNGNETLKIEQALESLSAGGSTNGQAGIQLAYQLAKQSYQANGINRVILATDGDFNVGISDVNSLKKLIKKKREEGISLTTLGFGAGNYNDALMEQLANVGNGNYAYIDGLNEARKVLVEELDSTLMTIAKDVKIQVEFNPEIVKEYRLLGYENRALAREDFNNDKVDAGEIGAGHTVTALYELVLTDSAGHRIDPLRYQNTEQINAAQAPFESDKVNELAFIKFRYKDVNETKSQLISHAILKPGHVIRFEQASEDFRFAATVAEFGEVLRQSKYIEGSNYADMIDHALEAKGADPFGYRSEFIQLLRLASSLN